MKSLAVACLVATLAWVDPVAAQPVWRCGPDGRLYSNVPCADGRVVDVADPRSAAQVAAAQEVAARERRLADRMRHERLEREHVAAIQHARDAAHAGLGRAGSTTPVRFRSGPQRAHPPETGPVAPAATRSPDAPRPRLHSGRTPQPARPGAALAHALRPADDGIFRAVAPSFRRAKD